jgi:hypothetical protein
MYGKAYYLSSYSYTVESDISVVDISVFTLTSFYFPMHPPHGTLSYYVSIMALSHF